MDRGEVGRFLFAAERFDHAHAALAVGERRDRPILLRHYGQRLDRRAAHRWVRSIGKRAPLGLVHPHTLRATFIVLMAALDVGG